MTNQSTPKEISAMAAMSSLKRDPMGMYDLGSDGVLRSFSGPYKHDVIDAIGLSPRQIKELVDLEPWTQEKEDKFRGVDGRKVTDRQQLFEPPLDSRKPDDTDESLEKGRAWAEEKNRELREQIEKDEREGVDVAEKYTCTMAVSNYDVRPRDVE
ncbi:hypothetical protein BKA65DRAFT_520631 [Rhexocercosporidium sp. MPI-PUGE-AT-0058]|nr:hypothetical protein BKA65DRAFT_520631 [Rhexocercosporidium sp. MPI-PUGE-AT-0058]